MSLSSSPPQPHNSNSHQQPSDANIALFEACAIAEDVRKVDRLLASGASPNWYNHQEGGQTALHAAAHVPSSSPFSAHATEIVQRLLAYGAVTNVLTLPDFNLPLHFAASAGNLATVKLLVEHDQKHINPKTLASAAASPFASLIKAPITATCGARQGNVFGNTPLHEACISGHEECVNYLLSQDVTTIRPSLVNVSNKRGSTPLLFSLFGSHPSLKLVTLLLANGADPTHMDQDGVGILHIAAMQGHREIVYHFLKEKLVGKAGWEKDANGHSPMFYAKMKGFDEIENMLSEEERDEVKGRGGGCQSVRVEHTVRKEGKGGAHIRTSMGEM